MRLRYLFAALLLAFSVKAAPEAEPPRSYSIEELFDKATSQSFESRIQFEHVNQAKLMFKNSYLNLLPHFSISSVTALVTMDLTTILGVIGDLVPFLIPSRWHEVGDNKHHVSAETFSLVLTKADSGNSVESLAFMVLRDQKIIAQMKANYLAIQSVRDEIALREKLGQFEVGSSDDITSLLNNLDKDLSVLDAGLQDEFTNLAVAAGFANPQAISGITIKNINLPATLPSDSSLTDTMLKKSIELKQMDEVIAAANQNSYERYWQWLDPAGDPHGGLGAGLPSYIKIGKSQVAELQVRKEQLHSILLQRLDSTIKDLNQSSHLYDLAQQSRAILDKRLTRLKNNMTFGVSLPLSDFINAFQDQLRNDSDFINAYFSYLISLSKINRLCFQEEYSPLLPPEDTKQ